MADQLSDRYKAKPLPGRGRRRLNENEKRSQKITTNFNKRELEIVDHLASTYQLTRSNYLRTAALKSCKCSEGRKLDGDLVGALGKASNAVNTLSAKACGRGGAIGRSECLELAQALLDLNNQLALVRYSLIKG